MAFGVAFLILLLTISLFSSSDALSLNHYAKTCPDVDSIVTNAVTSATSRDKTIPATLLRMHFHDCLIRGCDGSILLDSKGHHKAEKDAAPNLSLHAFFVVDNAKRALEAACPGVVSCADILALAARDAVVLSGGPYWSVPNGRKDGRVSRASDIASMPSPTFNISQLQKSFSLRGLSLDDLVALSGAHTIGFAHCAAFQNRIHNFNATHDIDPTLHPTFASKLQGRCPLHNTAKNAGVPMDPYSATFDNNYYKLILQRKSLFSSDQALLGFPKTKALVYKYASSKQAFWNAFANSVVKLSSINGGQEIRKNCRIVN
ncbi:Peroxidase 64 [Morus notabilis]|uniref:Peroxidase n=1 Tax=Morus notabilis TaxID=981085 RepID=W9SKH0_9ROSA|nr:peroxidase 64 [Morus notabilis]EXC35306.1 Peroxidase 64 [Morus notabilis]